MNISLRKKHSAYLYPRPPFNFDGTVYVPHHFPTPDFYWESGKLWHTMNFLGKLFGVKLEDKGTVSKPKIKATIYSVSSISKSELESITKELEWRYGLNEDVSGFCRTFSKDRFLGPVIKRWRGMRVNCANSLYELIIITIVLQNATIKRTVQMLKNLLENYGDKLSFDGKELFVYWLPEKLNDVSENELRSLKVGYRDKMIKRISQEFNEKINENKFRTMPTEEAKEELTKLYGIGPASSQTILTESLKRYDLFDLTGKVWEQKILSMIFYNKRLVPSKKLIKEFGKRYGNWQGLAFHYIFTDLFWKHKESKINWLEKEIRM